VAYIARVMNFIVNPTRHREVVDHKLVFKLDPRSLFHTGTSQAQSHNRHHLAFHKEEIPARDSVQADQVTVFHQRQFSPGMLLSVFEYPAPSCSADRHAIILKVVCLRRFGACLGRLGR
jgi:hypothetical protein